MAKTKAQAKTETKGKVPGLMGVPPGPAKAFDLTKREWFAGMAMAGILADSDYLGAGTVCDAVVYADDLLRELAKCPTKTGDE